MADESVVAAAGVLFCRPDGKVLLCRRVDDGHYWALPGGRIEAGETPEMAARREVAEETGTAYTGDLTPWTRRVADGVDYTTYYAKAPIPDPQLNAEHDQFKWATPEEALETGGLHPGVAITLLRGQMDESEIARAMAIGELTSPQRYQNLLLISLRVTGTGASYRGGAGPKDAEGNPVGEYVWRDPSLYLNDGFLLRCQGLPVVMDHPPEDKDLLDTVEFRDRVVGTLMLPFIRDDEVWAVAKIYDGTAAKILETEQLSTSPGVLVGGKRVPAGDGRDIFVEGKPSLLDHLAICVLGVWDKGGPAAGVLNQSLVGDTDMAEKTTEEKILDSLNGLHARMDAFEEGAKKDRARMDSYEAAQKDRAAKDAAAEEEAKKEKAAKDAAAEEQAKKDAEAKAEQDRKDKAAKDANDAADLKTRLDAVEGRLKEPTQEEKKVFLDAQMRAEPVFQAFGDTNGAPRWLAGETTMAYRKRLVGAYKDKSTAWKGVDLDKIVDEVSLANIEKAVFHDALVVAQTAITDSASPTLRAVKTADETGRQITRFYGNPEACWGPFKHRGKLVTGINTQNVR